MLTDRLKHNIAPEITHTANQSLSGVLSWQFAATIQYSCVRQNIGEENWHRFEAVKYNVKSLQ